MFNIKQMTAGETAQLIADGLYYDVVAETPDERIDELVRDAASWQLRSNHRQIDTEVATNIIKTYRAWMRGEY